MVVNVQEAEKNFSNLIAKFLDGEDIVIAQNGKPLLRFAEVEAKPEKRKLGFFNCDIDLSSFDDPIGEMKEYE